MSKSRVIRKQNHNYFKKNAKKEVMQLRRLINRNILLAIMDLVAMAIFHPSLGLCLMNTHTSFWKIDPNRLLSLLS